MTLVAAASARLAELWGSPVPAGAVLVDHADQAVFDIVLPSGRAAVAKVDRSSRRHARERSALATLAGSEVPVPPVVLADEGPPAVIVLDRVEGHPLSSGSRPASELGSGEAWTAAGRVLRQLHATPGPEGLEPFGWTGEAWGPYMRAWARRERHLASTARAALGDQVVDRLCDRIEEVLARTSGFPTVFLHGDAQAEHVLMNPEAPHNRVRALIDFGDTGVGDPAWDLAVLTLHHTERLADLLTGYRSDAVLVAHIDRVLPAYTGLRLLGSVTWMEEHGFSPERELEELATLERQAR